MQTVTRHHYSRVYVESEEVLMEFFFLLLLSSLAGRLVPRPSRVGRMINAGWLVWSFVSRVQFRGKWWS